jgi:predicted Fe-Mo cluster-binding NifX family protein
MQERQGEIMRVCIPTKGKGGLDEIVSEHFGRAPYYAIVDSESMECEFIGNNSEHYGGVGKPPDIIASAGAKAVLASGMGPRAMNMLAEKGVKAYCNVAGTVRESVEAFNRGELAPASAEQACKNHKH